jgi:hypothetical protein
VIKELHVTNGRVALWVGGTGLVNKDVAVPLPDIHLKDVGSPGGATAAEAGSAVFRALNTATAQAVANAAQPFENAAKTAEELVGQGRSKTLEGVKGLFK